MLKKEKNYYGIGLVLKELRKKKWLTQAKLAEKLGVSINAIKQYESNKREPQYDYLLKICDFFNVSPDYLQSKNHYRLDDVGKYECSRLIPQQKTIIFEQNLSLIQYKVLLDDIIKSNNDSTHILFLINSLNTLLANMTNICLNRKRNYLMYKSDLHEHQIVYDEMYFDYNKKNNTKTLRTKPLSEIEAYILAETKFDTYMTEIECDLKKIFIANFKEDYPAYKNNFKRKLHNLREENCE